jgi:hypothetical protein
MILMNFAHPLTAGQRAALERQTGTRLARVIDVPAQFDPAAPFAEQAARLIDAVGLTPAQWQTKPLLVNLPSLSSIAALPLAEVHGRAGYFPLVLRLRQVPGRIPVEYGLAELLNLQAVRDAARTRR